MSTLEEKLHIASQHTLPAYSRRRGALTSYSSFAIVAVGGEEGGQLGRRLER